MTVIIEVRYRESTGHFVSYGAVLFANYMHITCICRCTVDVNNGISTVDSTTRTEFSCLVIYF